MIRRNSFFWLVPMILITSMMGLGACGGGGGSSGGSNSSGGISCTLTGTVMTGSNPISGVVVTLFEAAATGQNADSLGSDTTNSNGTFSIPFTTPKGSAVLYVTATGGSIGGSSSSLAALVSTSASNSSCPSAITINELTTAAFAYTFEQFWNNGTAHNNGLSGQILSLSNQINLYSNLVTTSGSLTSLSNSTSSGTGSTLNSLADMISSCLNISNDCSTLFSSATPSGGVQPANTLEAAINISSNAQGLNWNNLFNLVISICSSSCIGTQPPPVKTGKNLPLTILGSNLKSPTSVAIDGNNNVWIGVLLGVEEIPAGQYFCTTSTPCPIFSGIFNSFVLSPTGVGGLAIDGNNNVWVANLNSVMEIPAGSTPGKLTPLVFSGSSLSSATAIAIDGHNNVWVANGTANTVVEIPSGSSPSSFAPKIFSGSGINTPLGLAVDGQNNIWVSNAGGNDVTKIPSGASSCGSCILFGNGPNGGLGSGAIAVDGKGNVWIAGNDDAVEIPNGTTSCAYISSTNTYPCPAYVSLEATQGGYQGGDQGIAIDGEGNVYLTLPTLTSPSTTPGAVLKIPYNAVIDNTTGTSNFGFCDPTCTLYAGGIGHEGPDPLGIAIDGSGNVFIVNNGINDDSIADNFAVPVAVPLCKIAGC